MASIDERIKIDGREYRIIVRESGRNRKRSSSYKLFLYDGDLQKRNVEIDAGGKVKNLSTALRHARILFKNEIRTEVKNPKGTENE